MAETEPSSDNPNTTESPKPRRARKAATRKTRSRKPRARKKGSARRSPSKGSLAAVFNDVAGRALAAGKELRSLSGEGAGAAKKALREATAASRRTITRLTKEWEAMDSSRRAQFVAALLAALAAASAPLVRRQLKK